MLLCANTFAAWDLVDALMGPWSMLPFAVLALLAIPYTFYVRRKRRLERWRQMGGPPTEPLPMGEPSPLPHADASDDPYLWARLVVAFVICAGLAWLCYRVLPRVGVDVPWWVPVLCFGVILVTMMVRRAGEREGAEEGGEHRAVAGRIGPDFMPTPEPESNHE